MQRLTHIKIEEILIFKTSPKELKIQYTFIFSFRKS